jgi:hypothetical protein
MTLDDELSKLQPDVNSFQVSRIAEERKEKLKFHKFVWVIEAMDVCEVRNFSEWM